MNDTDALRSLLATSEALLSVGVNNVQSGVPQALDAYYAWECAISEARHALSVAADTDAQTQGAQSAENADVRADAEAIRDGLNTLWGNGDIRFTAESRAALRDADAALGRLLGSLTDARRERDDLAVIAADGNEREKDLEAALADAEERAGERMQTSDYGAFLFERKRAEAAEARVETLQAARRRGGNPADYVGLGKLPWPSLVRNPEGRFSRALFALRNLW